MPRFEIKNGARLAAAAGLGLTLALGTVPGIALAADNDASATAEDAVTSPEDVASTGGETYESLGDAVANAEDGATVTLLKSVENVSRINIDNGKAVTVDLNGYDITFAASSYFLVNGGSLVITGTGTVKEGSPYYGPVMVYGSAEDIADYSVVTIDKGATLEGWSGVFIDYNKTDNASAYGINVKINGTINSILDRTNAAGHGIYINGTIKQTVGNVPRITVGPNAKITSRGNGIYAAGYAVWDIAGSVEGTTGIEIRAGEMTVRESAVIKGGHGEYNYNPNGNGSTSDNVALCVAQHTTKLPVKLCIEGGQFEATQAFAQIDPENNGEEAIDKIDMAIYGGTFTGGVSSENFSSENEEGFVFGGTFTNSGEGINSILAPGMTVDELGNVSLDENENYVATVTDADGHVLSGHETLADAVASAPSGGAVNILKDMKIDSTVEINGDVTVTSAEGVTINALLGSHSFKLSNGAMLDGLSIHLADASSAATNIVLMGNGSTVKNCTFTGEYEGDGDSEVSRGIETEGNAAVTIADNSFTNLRQPGYINASTGTISGNSVTGTCGWVVCGDSNMNITGNTFGENAVDIAIIDSNEGDQTNTNNYAKRAADISAANDGAYVENQLGKVEAKNGDIVVGSSNKDGYTLDAALAEADEGDTIRLEKDIEVTGQVKVDVTGITIDGDGHTITYIGTPATDTYPFNGGLIDVTADDVKIVDVTIDTKDDAKYGVQFWKADGGEISGSTIKGGGYACINVNGSDVKLTDTVLDPSDKAYAHIDLSMGSDVTEKPALTVDDVSFEGDNEKQAQVWVDKGTVDKLGVGSGQNEVLAAVNDLITNLGASDVTASVQVSDNDVANTVIDGKTPVTPPVVTGEKVNVEQPADATIKVTPSRADEGDTVTVTVTPDAGREVASVTVTDEKGNAVEVKPGEKDGTWTFEMPDGPVTVTATTRCDGGELCPSHGLTDVEVGAWYHDAVDWAVRSGLMSGYDDGSSTFGVSDALSRAHLAQMLWNQAGRPDVDPAAVERFSDCSADAWYAQAVAWCAEKGYMTGYDEGTFGPADDMTREQLATTLWRMAGSPEVDGDLSGYPDAGRVSAFAEDAMAWAVSEGAISGQGDTGALDPVGDLERCHAATIFMRLYAE